jgi:ubiquinol-cytochrome c reductase cytochrome b subunit
VLTTIAAVASVNPVWLYGPYRPDQVSTDAQPDWYLGFAEGLVRVMPGWEINAWGHTLSLGVLIPVVAFPLILIFMAVYPFLESWITGDKREHHLLDRPRNRPVRTGIGAAWIALYLILLAGGGNDILATKLHLSVNTITWTIRIAVFAVPAVVFIVTKRICLGLQRKDRELVLHGRETGVIKRLPHGEYVEAHEPLPQAELHRLTQHEQPRPLANGSGRLRRALSRAYYGPGTQVPKPTPAELAAHNGSGDGADAESGKEVERAPAAD